MRRLSFPCAALLAAALPGCSATPPTKAAIAPRAVYVAPVRLQAVAGGLAVSGRLVAREEAAVASQLSGFQVARVLVDQGDLVRRGEPMALLDATLLRADLAQQRANLHQAEVASQRAGQEAQRVAALDNTGVLSDEAIAERRLAARTAGAQLAQAQAQLDAQTVRARLMTVRAPVSGRVLSRSVRPGDVASPSNVMFTVAADEVVELDAEIPEQSLELVRPGQEAAVTLASGAVVTGRVRLVSAAVDADTRLGRARITLPVRADARSGGFAQAVFQAAGRPVPTVPDAAVTYGADGAGLMVVDARNRVRPVRVEVGRRANGVTELRRGPPPGTIVLTGSQDFVLPGDTVRPLPVRQGG